MPFWRNFGGIVQPFLGFCDVTNGPQNLELCNSKLISFPDKLTHIKSTVIIVQKVCKTKVFTKKIPKVTQNSPIKGARSGAKVPNFISKCKKQVLIYLQKHQ